LRVVPLPGYAQGEFDNWVEGEEEDSSDMAVTVFARYPGLSPQVYDEVVGTLDLDANPPIGAILHVVGESEEALQVAEIWRTEQAFQAFNDRFVSALQMRGYLSRPTIEITQLHNLFAVEMDTIERMGAVSLPGTYAGAAL
jgi:hypothetical protein